MAKFNGFEHHLLTEGLKQVRDKMKSDIDKIEKQGKSPLMTKGYVDIVYKEAQEKLDSFTYKNVFKDVKKKKEEQY